MHEQAGDALDGVGHPGGTADLVLADLGEGHNLRQRLEGEHHRGLRAGHQPDQRVGQGAIGDQGHEQAIGARYIRGHDGAAARAPWPLPGATAGLAGQQILLAVQADRDGGIASLQPGFDLREHGPVRSARSQG